MTDETREWMARISHIEDRTAQISHIEDRTGKIQAFFESIKTTLRWEATRPFGARPGTDSS